MRILISKFSNWSLRGYRKSLHPEIVTIRNIASRNPQHSFVLLGHGSITRHFEGNGVSFYNTNQHTLASYLFAFLLQFEISLILKPSVLVSLGTTNMIPLTMSSILNRTKTINVVTGDLWYSIKTTPKPFKKIFNLLLKVTFLKSQTILVLSKSIKKELTNDYGIPPEKIFTYSYRVSEIFNPDISKELKPILNPNGPSVLTVCRISPVKGLHYLIEASKIIVKKVPNVKIIIRGSEDNLCMKSNTPEKRYEAQLRKMIHDSNLDGHVAIEEALDHEDVAKYMSSADVFVLPSVSEGLPLVILEALATGVPVVASKVGGIGDILIDEENGLLVESGDVGGFAKAIIRILSDSELSKRLVKGALKTSRSLKESEFEHLLEDSIFGSR